MSKKRLFLIDAYALIFRAYYAFIKNPIVNSKGFETSAILGFFNSIFDIKRRENPDYLSVVFDKGGSADRSAIYSDYKSNRNATPEVIIDSVPYIYNILHGLGITTLDLEGYEADDIIGTVAQSAEKKDFEVYMVTPDKDFAQLVTENIFLYKPARFGNGIEIMGVQEINKKFEIDSPIKVIDYLGMMGDSVDNIPGIPGVGDKTAKKFLKDYGSIEDLYKNTSNLKGKLKEKVEDNQELAMLSKKLATIITNVPIKYDLEDLKISKPLNEQVISIFEELEFKRLKENYFKLFNQQDGYETTKQSTSKEKFNGNFISQQISGKTGIEILKQKLQKTEIFSFDLKYYENDVYLSFCWSKASIYYVKTDEKKTKELLNSFKHLIEGNAKKIVFNHKSLSKTLHVFGIKINNFFDIKIGSYLMSPGSRNNFKTILKLNLDIDSNDDDFDLDGIYHYNELFSRIYYDLKEKKLLDLLEKIENPLSYVLMKMEFEGIRLDSDLLNEIKKIFETEINTLESKIYSISETQFNIASPKQLGEVLFEKMILESNPKKTKTGQYSTSEDTLSKLAKKHEIIRLILDWRSLQKLLTTYVYSLPKQINPKSNKIHTELNQTLTTTGRLSSTNPNLQNIPVRTERGKLIRKCFIPRDKNHTLLCADYSQVELRVIAFLSGDSNMKNAFINNEDIHRSTAARVFNVSINDVNEEQRRNAKIVNFGIIYGVSAFGLSNQTDLTRSESKEIINNYFKSYPKLKEYMSDQISFARDNGYVETILKRKRYLPEINSRNAILRSSAERNAINTPVQGSAADIIKLSMIKIDNEFEKRSLSSKLLLQVHDELVFDVHLTEIDIVKKIIIDNMENVIQMDVPLKVDIGYGDNWLVAH